MPPKYLPWIIPEYCEECTSCVAACTPRVLAMRRIDPDTEIPWIENPDACTGCGRCADACGLGGIAMTEHVAEARERLLERYRDAG